MPLNKTKLKADLVAISTQLFNNSANLTPTQAIDQWATDVSNAIDDFVKSGDGIYQTGRLQAGANPVTANGSPAIKIQ